MILDENTRFLKKIQSTKEINEKIDLILRKVHSLILEENVEDIDDMLGKIQIHEFSIQSILSFLTSTLWLKGQLKNRQKLFESAKRFYSLTRDEEEVEELLRGLSWEDIDEKDIKRVRAHGLVPTLPPKKES